MLNKLVAQQRLYIRSCVTAKVEQWGHAMRIREVQFMDSQNRSNTEGKHRLLFVKCMVHSGDYCWFCHRNDEHFNLISGIAGPEAKPQDSLKEAVQSRPRAMTKVAKDDINGSVGIPWHSSSNKGTHHSFVNACERVPYWSLLGYLVKAHETL